MTWLMALTAGVIGFVLAYFSKFSVDVTLSPYISLAALAGLDSLIGGLRAGQEGKFRGAVFVSGFVVNTLLAAFLAYLGEQLGQPLALAAVVALGGRIFVNLSIIRREWMDRLGTGAGEPRRVNG
ncbi:MAG: small basic family protein [Capsulimonadaceae bacterium]